MEDEKKAQKDGGESPAQKRWTLVRRETVDGSKGPADAMVEAARLATEHLAQEKDQAKAESEEGKRLTGFINSGGIADVRGLKDSFAFVHYYQAYLNIMSARESYDITDIDNLDALNKAEAILVELLSEDCYGKQKFLETLKGDKLTSFLFAIAAPETLIALLKEIEVTEETITRGDTDLVGEIVSRLKAAKENTDAQDVELDLLKTFGKALVRHLQEDKPDLIAKEYSSFCIATFRANESQVKFFLLSGVDPNKVSGAGVTPMQVAVANFLTALRKENQLFGTEEKDECSVKDTVGICQIFLSHLSENGMETDPSLFSIVDPKGRNVLHYLSALDVDLVQILPTFIFLGAGVDIQDKEGNTPLHYAAQNGNVSLYEALVAQGANPKIRNDAQELPIDVAKDGDTRAALEVIEVPDEFENIAAPTRANSSPQDALDAIERMSSKGFSVNSPVIPEDTEPEDAFGVLHGDTLVGVPGSGDSLIASNATIAAGVSNDWSQEEGDQDSDEDGGGDDDDQDVDYAEKVSGGESDAEFQDDNAANTTLPGNQAGGYVVNEAFIASEVEYYELISLATDKEKMEGATKDAREYENSLRELELELSNTVAKGNFIGDIVPGSPHIDMDMHYVSEDIGITMIGKDSGVGPMPSVVS